MPTMGNTGASSLVKASASASTAIANYKDKVQAAEWDSSAQTDADYQAYTQYLSGRLEKTSKIGTLAGASASVTIQSTIKSVNRSYTSNIIQRTQQSVMNGDATSTNKLETIRNLYYAALDNGDNNLAQNLYTQYQTLDQQIQYEAQTAATANVALAEKNTKAQANGYTSAIAELEDAVQQMFSTIKQGGQAGLTAKLKEYAAGLGIELPTGAAATDGTLVEGAIKTIRELYGLAAQSVSVTDPNGKYSDYISAINQIDAGTKSVAGMNLQQAQEWAANPNAFYLDATGTGVVGTKKDGTLIYGTTYKPTKAAVIGYQYDVSGNIVPVYAPNNIVNEAIASNTDKAKDNTIKELEALGLNVDISNNGQITVAASSDKAEAQMFRDLANKYGLGEGNEFIATKDASGNYQFAPVLDSGSNQRVFTLAKDINSKYALYSQEYDSTIGAPKYNLIGTSDKSYNALSNSVVSSTQTGNVLTELQKSFVNYSTMAKGETENSIIPSIAKQYFNGDTKAAADAVYAYRKPLEQPSTANSGAGKINTLTNVTMTPTSPAVKAQIAAQPVTVASTARANMNNIAGPTFSPGQNTINSALKASFTDYKLKPKFYTENVVIKDIANKFYSGNTDAAKSVVYSYRKTNFGE
jgi:hypothetical protein